ncbi:hypothetical protein ACHAXA_009919 [Cyclostephanos tholiformis]|uniref:Pentatricopeptide repeat-containing protein n=1 Tax=Cyclostephanos tholiformis TaxID=382380 RepID=A0ABD3RXW7_9STRA
MQESSRFHPSHFEGRRMRSSASWPSSTISRRCLIHDLANKGSVLEHVESIKPRKLTLNRRKLPKLIRNCRADASGALGILANAYPHLAFSHDQLDEYVEGTTRDYSYEQLLDILYKGGGHHMDMDGIVIDNFIRSIEAGNGTTSDGILDIDGESIIATMEVFGKARNVPMSMNLLRLAVGGVRHNRQLRDQAPPSGGRFELDRIEDDRDRNELRRIYKAAFSLLGYTHERELGSTYCAHMVEHLLHSHMPRIAQIQPEAEIYYAAINALGKVGQYDLILQILDEMEQSHELILREEVSMLTTTTIDVVRLMTKDIAPHAYVVAYQTAISSLSRYSSCHEAMHLFYRMQSKGLSPDTNTYNDLLIGIAKEAGRINSTYEERNVAVDFGREDIPAKPWHKIALKILHEMEILDKNPTEQSYNSVMAACGKERNRTALAWVAKKAAMLSSRSAIEMRSSDKCLQNESDFASSAYFENLLSFRKIGKGRECWWEIGRYSVSCSNDENAAFDAKSRKRMRSIIIGIQPHRNPLCNGLSIVFHDETSRIKLGRILLRNASSRRPGKSERQLEPIYHSSLVGMEVNKTRRGEGLSKIFVAIWLHICLKINTYPRAAIINKPLISCVLMGFKFMPQNGGSRVGLIRLKDNSIEKDNDENTPQFGLYSPSAKSLQGLFSQRYLRMQNIAILDHPPSPASGQSGTIIYVKTGFEHPIAIFENAVEYSPPHSFANDDKLFVDERTLCEIVPVGLYQQNEQKQQTSTSQSIIQRKLLADQIDSILKTNVPANGNLEYFANVSSLEGAFLSCENLLFLLRS